MKTRSICSGRKSWRAWTVKLTNYSSISKIKATLRGRTGKPSRTVAYQESLEPDLNEICERVSQKRASRNTRSP